jgi:voltage-gated potassium channel
LFFVGDYAIRLVLSTRRGQFVRAQWLDLLLVVLPLLQPLRLAGALVRVARTGVLIRKTTRDARRLMGRHKLDLALAWAGILVLIAAVVTPLVEPDSSTIKTFGDGVWWSLVTTTTVGYGDVVPVSTAGRVIGALLMVAGVSIIGLITANIAAAFLEPADAGEAAGADPQRERLDAVEAKLDEVLRRLDEQLDH